MKLTDRLLEINVEIPEATPALGSYVPYKIINNFIYISGQLPISKENIVQEGEEISGNINIGTIVVGKVPSKVSITQAKAAAEKCILNTMPLLVLATNNANYEDIECVNISGFINADNDFDNHSEIINGASDLIFKILGENGKHSRIAVGCNSLPKNACVEISSIFQIKK
mgnify:FL=1|tara:strand:- start:225 stop:734 length:510 start_codon:yes stop_codon:yes gene_type:complete